MSAPQAFVVEGHYEAVLRLLGDVPPGRCLDVPAGQGAFALQLLRHGQTDVDCLDITGEGFNVPGARFTAYNANAPLPFPDAHFDHVFSIEGVEHFDSPFTFVSELCRVLKPGGRLFITTPNTFSVDARLKYLMSGYFPRFRPLMQEPHRLLADGDIRDTHIAPIYFWQLNYFLLRGGLDIRRLSCNARVYKPRWLQRLFENWIARRIRANLRRRHFPDPGISSDDVLFGDCIVIEAHKRPAQP
jgi:SAM-dependent methyltransferase